MAVRTGHGILMVKAVIYWQIRGRECWGAEYTHLTLKTSYTGYMDTGLHGYGDTGLQGYMITGLHGMEYGNRFENVNAGMQKLLTSTIKDLLL